MKLSRGLICTGMNYGSIGACYGSTGMSYWSIGVSDGSSGMNWQ